MLGRMTAVAVLALLAGCAGVESAGRTSTRAPQASAPPPAVASAPPAEVYTPPPAVASAPLPAPAPVQAAPPPVAAPQAAPQELAAQDPPRTVVNTERQNESDIIVPGERERQVPAPDGDPRSRSERLQDINAWDRCITTAQSAFERDPMRPQLSSPEEYCSQSLGMSDRNAIPLSRQERRR